MGRYRSRSPSRSPPRRKRYDDPRDRHHRLRADHPTGLLVRNIALDARPEDLRVPFERFGPIKDVYLPKNYYTGEPRGFGFVKFVDPNDAAEARDCMEHQIIGGREISIVFAEENRKTPQEMRRTSRMSDRYVDGSSRRRSPQRSPRHRYRSYSRSRSPPRRDSRDRYRSSPARSVSPPRDSRKYKTSDRSPSPKRSRRSRSRSHSRQADRRSPSPGLNGRGPSRSRSYSP